MVSFFGFDVVFEEFADEVGAAFGDVDSGLAARVSGEEAAEFADAVLAPVRVGLSSHGEQTFAWHSGTELGDGLGFAFVAEDFSAPIFLHEYLKLT